MATSPIAVKCPLFRNPEVLCRIKPQSHHRWVGTEQQWYAHNYCGSDYFADCEDHETYLAQRGIVTNQVSEGTPEAKLLFVIEVLPNEQNRLTPHLRETFMTPSRCGGIYQVDFAYSLSETLEKLMAFKLDLVVIYFDSLYQIKCDHLLSCILASPFRPKEVLVFGLNLEAMDKQTIERLGARYVDQRKSFAQLITAVRQTAIRCLPIMDQNKLEASEGKSSTTGDTRRMM